MMLMPDFIIIQQKAVGSVWYKLGIEHDLDRFSMMKHCDTKHNVEEKYLFHSLSQITIPSLKVMRAGTQSGHKHGGRRCYIGVSFWLADHGMFSLPFYISLEHQSRDGTINNGLDPAPSTTIKMLYRFSYSLTI